ncbi:MAG: flagellar basal-body rod protein FlgF [Vicinamibacterales bacterium]
MASGAYVALSGLRARMEQLDRIAADLSNVDTAGYKAERVTTAEADRAEFGNVLQSAIDVAASPGHLDFRNGVLTTSGRDLDMALDGKGFFAVQTPNGERYTRSGQFTRSSDGTLQTLDGFAVLGESGPIRLPAGEVSVEPDGTVHVDKTVVGKLKVVDFSDYGTLQREQGTRFRSTAAPIAPAKDVAVRGGALENSNVSMVERIAQLTEVARSFEGLQKGFGVLMNDVYGRAISELGRR